MDQANTGRKKNPVAGRQYSTSAANSCTAYEH
jgi:hypothetical protein